jgi:hypothetical protein
MLFVGARLAQSVERKALNLVVVGSSPTVGVYLFACFLFCFVYSLSYELLFLCKDFKIRGEQKKKEAIADRSAAFGSGDDPCHAAHFHEWDDSPLARFETESARARSNLVTCASTANRLTDVWALRTPTCLWL